MIKLFKSLY